MTSGLKVINTTNNLVVDMTYQNLSLQAKQDFSLSGGGTLAVSHAGCVSPLICIYSTDYVGLYSSSISDSTYTWNIKASAAATGTVYIFDKPNLPHTSTYGLKVLANDGVTEIFNSDNKYLRVVGILDVPWSAGFSNATFAYFVAGGVASNTSLTTAKYAVCISNSRVDTDYIDGYNFRRRFDGVKSTSTSVSVAQVVSIDFVAGGGGDHPGIFAGSGSGTVPALIVNVEGY